LGRRLFGTDGVRGVVGEELTADLALELGRAAAAECPAARPQVLIVRDTRESGPMLEAALAAGIAEGGGDALLAGVLPTPAASVLVRRLGLDLAAVISASHNPWRDNGIKLFGADGRKVPDERQAAIERRLAAATPAAATGRVRRLEGGLDDYLRELERGFGLELDGMLIVLDCANGATHRAAPLAFQRLGLEVELIGDEPDGRNINEGCGSTHLEPLRERVVGSGADLGFAFDGDGDRVLAVDAAGDARDGDDLIALIALHLRDVGELPGGVAVTVMSNYGFHEAMREAAIEVATTNVGDRHVAAELERRGWTLGGEQSGHVIWTEFAPTGDGIAAALLVLRALAGRPLAEAVPMRRLPQVLVNVETAERTAIEDARGLWDAVEAESEALAGRGRVLVRPSGTEAVVRVMVEAPDRKEAEAVCERLAHVVRRELA